MKVLWLCNKVLSDFDEGATGTWLDALAGALLGSGGVELGSIAPGQVSQVTRRDQGPLKQWVIPVAARAGCQGLPGRTYVDAVAKIAEAFSPDVVHVWGTESYWGLFVARGKIPGPAVLETQGLKFAIAKVYGADLTFRERLSCLGLKEILRRSSIWQGRRQFEKWGRFEKEMIARFPFIATQSPWLEAQVRSVNTRARIFNKDLPLRALFYNSVPWSYSGVPTFFCTSGYGTPFKAIHVAIRALAILKGNLPDCRLRVGGARPTRGIRKDGYLDWVRRESRRLGVESQIDWLGYLSADRIAVELKNCSAFLIPSFIEGYCLALSEAMMLGVPCVVSYVGGPSTLYRDRESVLFFPPGDSVTCASQMGRLVSDPDQAKRLSKSAREIAIRKSDLGSIVREQMEIYRVVAAKGEGAR